MSGCKMGPFWRVVLFLYVVASVLEKGKPFLSKIREREVHYLYTIPQAGFYWISPQTGKFEDKGMIQARTFLRLRTILTKLQMRALSIECLFQ